MSITNCQSGNNLGGSLKGVDPIYSFLSTYNIILPADTFGNIKSYDTALTIFRMFQGITEIDLDPAKLIVASSNLSSTVYHITKNDKYLVFTIDSIAKGINSTYFDFSYIIGNSIYYDRFEVLVVRDGAENDTLIYSDNSTHTFTPTLIANTNQIPPEFIGLQISSSGLFKFKGDQIRITFMVNTVNNDNTRNYPNYFGLKLDYYGNSVFFYQCELLGVNENYFCDLTLTAVNGLYGNSNQAFLQNDQVSFNLISTGMSDNSAYIPISTNEYQLTNNCNGISSFIDTVNIVNTNLGNIQFVYGFGQSYVVSRSLKLSMFRIERLKNANII